MFLYFYTFFHVTLVICLLIAACIFMESLSLRASLAVWALVGRGCGDCSTLLRVGVDGWGEKGKTEADPSALNGRRGEAGWFSLPLIVV